MPQLHRLLLVLLLAFQMINASYFTEIDRLHKDLMTGYNKDILPQWNKSQPVDVSIVFHLLNLNGIDSVKGVIAIAGYFIFQWIDVNMQWTPANYTSIENIVIPLEKVWKPPVINANSVMEYKFFGAAGTFVRVNHTGLVTWTPGINLEFSCNMDTTKYPFDTQMCELEVMIWGYSSEELTFTTSRTDVDISFYQFNNEWELMYTSAVAINTSNLSPLVQIETHFERRSLYYVMNLIFPVMLLALLNLFVFLLPQDSGERVGFSVTLLLANVMFLTIAENMLPATAIPRMSAICIALLLNLCYSGLIVITVIISGNIYHKPDEQVISNWIVKFVQIGKLFRSNHKQVSSEMIIPHVEKDFDGEKYENRKENNLHKVNWQQVARMVDRIALISYITLFIFGCSGVFIDCSRR
ncbi:acetylcholine receptor subunit alpha-like [Mytilus trossulus]|uniref:acetylcholine receptor subunit alpha-like n=1 Tax=Mytilus trossulus TaxID=6551 RepID=UPI003005BEFB